MGHLFLRELCEGNLEGGSFTGDPENMLSKALEMDICFHGGHAFGETEGAFLGPLREGIIFLFRGIFIRNLRDM